MSKSNPPQLFISRSELAARWHCSTMTIRRREKSGTLKPVVLGRGVLYRTQDVESVEREAAVNG